LVSAVYHALRKTVEKEIERSTATAPGDDKIGFRVSRECQIAIEPVRHPLILREGRGADIRNPDVLLLAHQQYVGWPRPGSETENTMSNSISTLLFRNENTAARVLINWMKVVPHEQRIEARM
jgi:hypothetical protein